MPAQPASTSAAQPHPRAALRNRNLPKLPDFEFPVRERSPQPPSPSQPQRAAPPPPRTQQQQDDSSPILTPQLTSDQTEAQLEAEILFQKSRGNTPARGSNQAKGTQGAYTRLDGGDKGKDSEMAIEDMSKKGQWIFYAVTSGGCAAVNGVFAKLTTTEVTTNFATFLANIIGLQKGEKVFEFIVRAIFFLLNLVFNAIMWALFTKALSRSPSTTQVSILNTSSNFMLTALMGFIIFSESLPPLWWLGAAMLVAGNVIIGKREEKEVPVAGEHEHGAEPSRAAEGGAAGYRDSREEDRALLADDIELSETESEELKRKRIAREVEEHILDLEPPNGAAASRV